MASHAWRKSVCHYFSMNLSLFSSQLENRRVTPSLTTSEFAKIWTSHWKKALECGHFWLLRSVTFAGPVDPLKWVLCWRNLLEENYKLKTRASIFGNKYLMVHTGHKHLTFTWRTKERENDWTYAKNSRFARHIHSRWSQLGGKISLSWFSFHH